jgi:hypothetical protein
MRASPLRGENRSEAMKALLPLANSCVASSPGRTVSVASPSGAISRMRNSSREEYQTSSSWA